MGGVTLPPTLTHNPPLLRQTTLFTWEDIQVSKSTNASFRLKYKHLAVLLRLTGLCLCLPVSLYLSVSLFQLA